MSNLTNFIANGLKAWVPQLTVVRHRYFADKERLIRRYGYKEKIDQKGLLAHTGGDNPVQQQPVYRPINPWTERKALFGQNDYIDILGVEELKVTKVMYHVPMWLRGVKNNEFRVLLRKRAMLKNGAYPIVRPTKWRDLNKRIRYLWKFLNQKTRPVMSRD